MSEDFFVLVPLCGMLFYAPNQKGPVAFIVVTPDRTSREVPDIVNVRDNMSQSGSMQVSILPEKH